MNNYNNVKSSYVVYVPFDYVMSNKQFIYAYGPIVGEQAMVLYQWLVNEYNIQNELKGISSPIERILRSLDINATKFAEIRERLEAIGLLTTYVEEQGVNKRVFHFEIKAPLSWQNFNENQKMRHLLISKIGLTEYERISLVFVGKRIPANVLNISATFNSIYDNKELQKISEVNFEQLHELLSHELNYPVLIDHKARLIIETFFKNNNFNLDEIKSCICKSLTKDLETNSPAIDTTILTKEFRNLANGINNVSAFKMVSVTRNNNLFLNKISEQQKDAIFADYNNLNPECYLSSIQKNTLDDKQKETIHFLQNFSHLSDEVINMITDFTLYRTKGKYNTTYIKKLANSINCLGLTTLDTVLEYLTNVALSINNHNVNQYKTKQLIFSHEKLPEIQDGSTALILDNSTVELKTTEVQHEENDSVSLDWFAN